MKAKYLILGLLAIAVVGLGTNPVNAQDARRGTAGASELLVPLTARSTSLSAPMTSGMADVNPIEAIQYNPAAMSVASGTSALFSRSEYVADIGINYFGAAQAFGNNVIALSVNSWDFGDLPKTTETNPDLSDLTFDASTVIFGLSYARQFTDRIAAGLTLKALSQDIEDVSSDGIAFDAGMTYVAGESGLRFGVALKHFGPQMEFSGTGLTQFATLPSQQPDAKQNALQVDSEPFELPSQLNVGLAYTRQLGASADVTFMGNFASNSFSQDQFAGGLEFGLMQLVYLRGGIMLQEDMDFTFFQEYNLGAGLNLDFSGSRLTVDYAYRPTEFFDDVNMFTVGFEL